jgi:hypothetical protein
MNTAKLNSLSSESVDYLLADFRESTSQEQHMNDRMDKEIQYYLALFGIAGTVTGLLLQYGQDVFVTLGVVHLLALLIGIAGFRLLRRIIHLTGQSALFSSQVGLIRRGFIDLDERVAPYVILTTATTDDSAHHFTPVSKQLSVRLLLLVNSVMLISVLIMMPLYLYLYYESVYSLQFWVSLFTVTGIISIVGGGLFFWYQRHLAVLRGDRYLDHVTHIVQQRRSEMTEQRGEEA